MEIFMLALGLVVGSFLNVCIIRIPHGTFFKYLRSHCPQCEAMIPWWGNIPLLSFVALRGRSRCCGKPISLQYPLVECITALLFLVIYKQHPFVRLSGIGALGLQSQEFIFWLHLVVFTCLMIIMAVIDYHHQIIPDILSLPMIVASAGWIMVHPLLTWQSSLGGILVGGGVLYLAAWLYYIVRKEYGLGFGDVKLLAAIGGWLGVESILPTLFMGSIMGSLVGLSLIAVSGNFHLKTRLPFGPFLGAAAVIHMLVGPQILSWILG